MTKLNQMVPDWKQCETLHLPGVWALIHVAEAQGFSRAADRLGVTKSAISKRIAHLEEELGVRLLERNTRPVSLTEAGERFLVHARSAMDALTEACGAAAELQQEAQGTLRVLSLMSFGRLHVVPLISQFRERYPRIEIDLTLDDRTSALTAGDFDVAIRAGALTSSALIARKVASLHSAVCASPQYLEENGRPRRPADLRRHNCLVYSLSAQPNMWTFIRGGRSQSIEVSGDIAVNNGEALCELVRRGEGVARLPTFVAGSLIASGALTALFPRYTMPAKNLYVVLPSRRFVPRRVRVFVDFVVEAFGTSPPAWEA